MKNIVKVITILVILLVIISIFYAYSNKQKKSTEVMSNEVMQNNTINEKENTLIENNKEEKEESIVNEEKEKNTFENVQNEEKQEKNNITDEEKAINLVKEKYGMQDNSVSYKIVNKNDKEYTIQVSDNTTTQVMGWYTVNIETKNVIEE